MFINEERNLMRTLDTLSEILKGNEENKQNDVTAYIRPNLSEMMEGCEFPEADITIKTDGIPTVEDSICL